MSTLFVVTFASEQASLLVLLPRSAAEEPKAGLERLLAAVRRFGVHETPHGIAEVTLDGVICQVEWEDDDVLCSHAFSEEVMQAVDLAELATDEQEPHEDKKDESSERIKET